VYTSNQDIFACIINYAFKVDGRLILQNNINYRHTLNIGGVSVRIIWLLNNTNRCVYLTWFKFSECVDGLAKSSGSLFGQACL